VRTIFIDITTVADKETYRLLEVHFKDDLFDEVEVLSACEYRKNMTWSETESTLANLHPKGISSF